MAAFYAPELLAVNEVGVGSVWGSATRRGPAASHGEGLPAHKLRHIDGHTLLRGCDGGQRHLAGEGWGSCGVRRAKGGSKTPPYGCSFP